jgi:hypothetical protein
MLKGSERARQSLPCVAADHGLDFNDYPDDSMVGASIHWTLAMMEHMFARRPELETYAWRIQGAA